MSDQLACHRLAAAVGFFAVAIATLPGQTNDHSKAIPRASDGHPDLQGVWTNATLTPLERPADLAGKATLTDAEAKITRDGISKAIPSIAMSRATLTRPPEGPASAPITISSWTVDRSSPEWTASSEPR